MYIGQCPVEELDETYYIKCRPCRVADLMVSSTECIGIYFPAQKYLKFVLFSLKRQMINNILTPEHFFCKIYHNTHL